jgi:hypothetical protein
MRHHLNAGRGMDQGSPNEYRRLDFVGGLDSIHLPQNLSALSITPSRDGRRAPFSLSSHRFAAMRELVLHAVRDFEPPESIVLPFPRGASVSVAAPSTPITRPQRMPSEEEREPSPRPSPTQQQPPTIEPTPQDALDSMSLFDMNAIVSIQPPVRFGVSLMNASISCAVCL